jgi:hypothetical protein
MPEWCQVNFIDFRAKNAFLQRYVSFGYENRCPETDRGCLDWSRQLGDHFSIVIYWNNRFQLVPVAWFPAPWVRVVIDEI